MSITTTPSLLSEKPRNVVLITGSTSGIGKTCAAHMGARGYRVFGTQRRVTEGETAPPGVELITMDVDSDESVNRAIRVIIEKAGRLDAVVNNAGFALMGSIEDTSIEEARAQIETNFFGVLRVCRAVLPIMRQQGRGHIINISSLAGVLGLPFSGLYSASKFALEGMSESLRFEARRFGIRVVLVEPGDFNTQLPAKRRTALAAESSDAYREAFTKFKAAQEKDESKAPTPEPIAYLIERILLSDAPKLRYTIGMLGQRIVVPLKRFLPQPIFEWVLRKVLGL